MVDASWQPDPSGAHELRYWNGTDWTEHVSDQGTTGQDPLTAPLPPPLPAPVAPPPPPAPGPGPAPPPAAPASPAGPRRGRSCSRSRRQAGLEGPPQAGRRP